MLTGEAKTEYQREYMRRQRFLKSMDAEVVTTVQPFVLATWGEYSNDVITTNFADGDMIRHGKGAVKPIWQDFTEGGNDQVYAGSTRALTDKAGNKANFVNPGQFLIDWQVGAPEVYCTLGHELKESNTLILNPKMDYDTAHEQYANPFEQEIREATPERAKELLQAEFELATQLRRTIKMQAVKFIDEEKGIVRSLVAPFGGPFNGKDLQGDYFSKNTDFCLGLLPVRPALYQHGTDPDMKLEKVGEDFEWEVLDDGLWANTQLNKSNKYWESIRQLIKAEKLYRSTMAIPHLVERKSDGEITRWPWIETSFTPNPANFLAAVGEMKFLDGIDTSKIEELETEQILYFKITEKEGAPKSPPKGYPTAAEDYGDPKNFKYPIDKKHIKAAVSYFNHPGNQKKGDYTSEEWATIGKRIAARANKLIGPGHSFSDGKIEVKETKAVDTKKDAKKDTCPTCGRDIGTPDIPDEADPQTDLSEPDKPEEPDLTTSQPGVSQGMAPETHSDGTDHITKAVKGGTNRAPDSDGTNNAVATKDKDVAPAKDAYKDGDGALSTSDLRSALATALQTKYSTPWGIQLSNVYIQDVFNDGTFVFEGGENLYKMGYTVSGDVVTLTGEPVQVARRTVYDPVPITTAGAKEVTMKTELTVEAKDESTAIKSLLEEAVAPLRAELEALKAQPVVDQPVKRQMAQAFHIAPNPRMGLKGDETEEMVQKILDDSKDPVFKKQLGDQIAAAKMAKIMSEPPTRLR